MQKFIDNLIYFFPLISAAILMCVVSILLFLENKKIGFLKKNKIREQVVIGIIYGLCVIYANEIGGIDIGGAIINARDAGPLCAGLIFGSPAGIIAGVIGGIERWFSVYWGGGEYTRLGCSIACVLAGIIAMVFRKFIFHEKRSGAIPCFFIALVTEVIHLLLVFFTHLYDVDTAFDVVQICSFPIISATCLSVFVTILISNVIDPLKKEGNNIAKTLQLRLVVIIIFSFLFFYVFEYVLLAGSAIQKAERVLKVNVMDSYYSYIKNDGMTLQQVLEDAELWHIEETGGIVIVDDKFVPIKYVNENKVYKERKLVIPDTSVIESKKLFSGELDGIEVLLYYKPALLYNIVGYVPFDEIYATNYMVLYISVFGYIIIFTLLFVCIYVLVNKMIVKNIKKINLSLANITSGNLHEEVNVRKYEEFNLLSTGINCMVSSLKKLINEAENRVAEELIFAKKIQLSSLPSVFPPYPSIKSFDIYASTDPAKEVGGDFYDFYFLKDNRFVFLVADVSGKGIPAAMFMMKAKSIIKNFAESGAKIEDIMSKANDELCDNNEAEMFVTLFIYIIDLKTGIVEYVNAGHNPPVLVHNDGNVEYFNSKRNLVLAGMEGIKYNKSEFKMEKGDALYMYTDGVTEAINISKELYGEDRLIEVIKNNYLDNMEVLCNKVSENLTTFVDGADQFDDITMLAFRYNGEVFNERNNS